MHPLSKLVLGLPLVVSIPVFASDAPKDYASTATTTTESNYVINGAYSVRVESIGSNGNNSGKINFVNNDIIEVLNDSTFNGFSRVFWGRTVGGNGANSTDKDKPAGFAGNTGSVSFTNEDIIKGSGVFNGGLAVLDVGATGGSGGSVIISSDDDFDDDGLGRPGGNAGSVSVTNNFLVESVSGTSGQNSFYGIHAYSVGGNAGVGKQGSVAGDSGSVTVNNNYGLHFDWTSLAPASLDTPAPVYGIRAVTRGGDGSDSNQDSDDGGVYDGGAGGFGAPVVIYLSKDADVSLHGNANTDAQLIDGAAVQALAHGGDGGKGWKGSFDRPNYGGVGGATGNASIDVNSADVSTTGDYLKGLHAKTLGGNGGQGVSQNHNFAGSGGAAGLAYIDLFTADIQSVSVETTGDFSDAVVAESLGGMGGTALDPNQSHGGDAGDGGNGGAAMGATVYLNKVRNSGAGPNNDVSVSTSGDQSNGITISIIGGQAGNGAPTHVVTGEAGSGSTNSGTGGSGGTAHDGIVEMGADTSVETSGESSLGVNIVSQGGAAGDSGRFTIDATTSNPPNGGHGGSGGNLTVLTAADASVTTGGQHSSAIVAISSGGQAGNGGGASSPIGGTSGDGGSGGNSGAVTITNNGFITTSGDYSRGIVAQGKSGQGGAAGDADVSGSAHIGAAGASGLVGEIKVINYGSIHTSGSVSHGILMQSLAGAAGQAGNSNEGFFSDGGDGGTAANGGSVHLNQDGRVISSGNLSHAVLMQTIGGGGGDGGDSSGFFSDAGDGSAGGNGGSVIASFYNGTTIASGTQSHAFLAQSIGGGGGNGGNATSAAAELAYAVGGSGGAGGDGGKVQVSTASTIYTGGGFTFVDVSEDPSVAQNKIFTGSRSTGFLAQSIGGGGGNGGAAYALAVGADLGAAVAVGGTGGDGGDGGQVIVGINDGVIWTGQLDTTDYTLSNVQATDAIGVLAQSIGGGGGNGGAASAEAVSIAIPLPGEAATHQFTASFAVGAGGDGAPGGDGGEVSVNVDQAKVITQGQGSHAVMGQSIGGGGGNGGDSSTMAATIGYSMFPLHFAGSGNSEPEEPEIPEVDPESAAPAPGKVNFALKATVTVGGDGGDGGNGGIVNMTVGDDNGSSAAVSVFGDSANAVMAQSIGGGGGNAGVGNSNTASYGTTQSETIEIGLGSTGGKGGQGGSASTTVRSGAKVVTHGAGSHGMLVQSIGGGGGTSQGGNFALGMGGVKELGESGVKELDLEGKISLTFGATGGAGGNGGNATATVDGNIVTFGGDSTGVLVQSIGGGGGVAGGAGSEASADNPISLDGMTAANNGEATGDEGEASGVDEGIAALEPEALQAFEKIRSIIKKLALRSVPLELEAEIEIGSNDVGASGKGGDASATIRGSVSTSGDWSEGVVVQSIGGGGGKGGTSSASGLDISTNINYKVAGINTLPGGGSEKTDENGVVYNANGGTAEVTLDGGLVVTGQDQDGRGFSAIGIHLQSVGGGGGIAIDGSDTTNGSIFLGDGDGATDSDFDSYSAEGNGGSAYLSGNGNVTTYGTAAHGILLQSIGGGGGFAGAGSSASTASDSDIELVLGGNAAAKGYGGPVQILPGSVLKVDTYGDHAYGILAQSIGGGGGLGAVVDPTSSIFQGISTNVIDPNLVKGGNVTLSFASGTSIMTSGFKAYGIVAQTIGGGGGVSGYSNGSTFDTIIPLQLNNIGNSGRLSLTLEDGAQVVTSGFGAHAVFVQAIGSGGGILATENGTYAGRYSDAGNGFYDAVDLQIDGVVAASGADAYGIFAQADGTVQDNAGPKGITIDVGSTGSISATDTAIRYDGGKVNVLNIADGGRVSGSTAIEYTGTVSGDRLTVNVANNGTLAGSVLETTSGSIQGVPATVQPALFSAMVAPLQQPELFVAAPVQSNRIQIENAGRIIAGERMEADIMNRGLFRTGYIGEERLHTTTTVAGSFTQSSEGVLVIDTDFKQGLSDTLEIEGDAEINGKLRPVFSTVVANRELEVLRVEGALTGDLVADSSTEDGFNVFDLALRNDGGRLYLSATGANFAPAGMTLSDNAKAIADNLEALFEHDDIDDGFGEFFADLGTLAANDSAGFADSLAQLSPGAALGFAARSVNAQQAFGNTVLNGPIFAGSTAKPVETASSWGRVYGRKVQVNSEGGAYTGYDIDTYIVQAGGQMELRDGLFVGGSLAYQNDRLNGDMNSGDADSAFAAATVKYEMGDWLFAGALTGSAGWIDADRHVNLGGQNVKLNSSQRIQTLGAVARVAYSFYNDVAYFRPMVTGNIVYLHADDYREKGDSNLRLDVDSENQTTFIITPGFETGLRTNLSNGKILRTYLVAGVSFLSEDEFSQKASFVNAPSGHGGFTARLPIDDVSGQVTTGFQLQLNDRVSCFIQYEGEFSDNVNNNGGGFGFKVSF